MYIMSNNVLYRGLEGNYLICDIPKDKCFPKMEGVKLKIENDEKLITKINGLRRRTRIWITYKKEMPLGSNTKDITVIKVLTKDEYMVLYKPYKEAEEKMMKENMKQLRKAK